MKFCSECGGPLTIRVPEGENRERHCCDACDIVHYLNPKVVAGCVATWEDKVLLCRRAIEPRYGRWTLPGGFMENDETTEQAAVRETWEEATASVTVLKLYNMFSLPYVNQVYLMYLAQLDNLDFKPGIESLDVKLFELDEIPWHDLAFHTVTWSLKFLVEDQASGVYSFREGALERRRDETVFIHGPANGSL